VNTIVVVGLIAALLAGGAAAFFWISKPQTEEISETTLPPPRTPEQAAETTSVLPETPPDATSSVPVDPPVSTAPPSSPLKSTPPPGAKPQTKPPVAPAAPRAPQEFIVRMHSDSRAEPSELVVRVGDTVTFVNEDDKLHWPGADPHPTHSSLPTFDALGGISKGQSFSHTFRVPGTFGYHEHLLDDPPTMGIITVLP